VDTPGRLGGAATALLRGDRPLSRALPFSD